MILRDSRRESQNLERKTVPLSDSMSSGKPWSLKILLMYKSARSEEDMDSLQGIKWACFVKRQTTTNMESKPFDLGNLTMKSMDKEDHGLVGTGKG